MKKILCAVAALALLAGCGKVPDAESAAPQKTPARVYADDFRDCIDRNTRAGIQLQDFAKPEDIAEHCEKVAGIHARAAEVRNQARERYLP